MLQVAHELPMSAEYDAIVTGWRKAWPRALDRLAAYLTPAGSP
jgi:hypothetical protein